MMDINRSETDGKCKGKEVKYSLLGNYKRRTLTRHVFNVRPPVNVDYDTIVLPVP